MELEVVHGIRTYWPAALVAAYFAWDVARTVRYASRRGVSGESMRCLALHLGVALCAAGCAVWGVALIPGPPLAETLIVAGTVMLLKSHTESVVLLLPLPSADARPGSVTPDGSASA